MACTSQDANTGIPFLNSKHVRGRVQSASTDLSWSTDGAGKSECILRYIPLHGTLCIGYHLRKCNGCNCKCTKKSPLRIRASCQEVSIGIVTVNNEMMELDFRVTEIQFHYERKPWLWLKPIFYLLQYGSEYDRCMKILKGFTSRVCARSWKPSIDRRMQVKHKLPS